MANQVKSYYGSKLRKRKSEVETIKVEVISDDTVKKTEDFTTELHENGLSSKVRKIEDVNNEDDVEAELTYEQKRLKNLRENEQFLVQLRLEEDKSALHALSARHSNKSSSKSSVKRKVTPRKVPPKRRSARLCNVKTVPSNGGKTGSSSGVVHLSTLNSEESITDDLENEEPVKDAQSKAQSNEDYHRERLPAGSVSVQERLYGSSTVDDSSSFLMLINKCSRDVKPTDTKVVKSPPDSFAKKLMQTSISEELVHKVASQRLFSLTVHPTADKVIVCAGDKWGRLGLWDVESTSKSGNVIQYEPHVRPIKHLAFHPLHSDQLYTCSYDGTLRCLRVEHAVFDEVYRLSEDISLYGFDFHGPASMLVGQSDGAIVVLDTRTDNSVPQSVYATHKNELRSVSVHPTLPHYFVSASKDCTVALWDLRNMRKDGKLCRAVDVVSQKRLVESAYFSPVTGHYILSTSMDDTVKIIKFSTSDAGSQLQVVKSIGHNNQTGRWLTNFRAVWHPAREDMFAIGSMDQPRRMQLFSCPGGALTHTFANAQHLTTVCSLLAFHHTRPVVVGGNSTGKVHVFM